MTSGTDNRCDLVRWSLMRTVVRQTRAICKTCCTLFEITVDPFVAGLAADVVKAAEFRDREHLP